MAGPNDDREDSSTQTRLALLEYTADHMASTLDQIAITQKQQGDLLIALNEQHRQLAEQSNEQAKLHSEIRSIRDQQSELSAILRVSDNRLKTVEGQVSSSTGTLANAKVMYAVFLIFGVPFVGLAAATLWKVLTGG